MPALADLVSLDAAESSEWFDLSGTIEDVSLHVSGTFVATWVVDVSVDKAYGTGKSYNTLAGSYTTGEVLGLPRAIGTFIRVRVTSYTSGTLKVGFTQGIDADGNLYAIVPETRFLG